MPADPGPVRIELKGPAWWPEAGFDRRPEALRRAYWTRLGELAVAAHRDQSRRGIGSDGSRLARVKAPRPDGADGPPLSPHRAESRTRRNLTSSPGRDGVTLWWRGGWGRVLGYHARRGGTFVRGAPVRDVIGLSPRAAARARRQARTYWRNLVGAPARGPRPGPAIPVPLPGPVPTPTPTPRPRPSFPPPAPVPLLVAPAPLGVFARIASILARPFRRASPVSSVPRLFRSRPAFLR